jgi:hypothetical protein
VVEAATITQGEAGVGGWGGEKGAERTSRSSHFQSRFCLL